MKKFINFLSTLLILTVTITSLPAFASPNNTNENINADQIILESGTPENILNELLPEDKAALASFIKEGNAIYGTASTTYYKVDENTEELVPINPLFRGEISKADLKFELNCWTSTTGATKGNTYVTGTYEWLTYRQHINDHLFTISMPDGWWVDASTIKKVTWRRQNVDWYEWTLIDSVAGRAFDSSDRSVTWSSLSDGKIWDNVHLYKGNCSFVARKESSSAKNQVKLQYGYGTGSGTIGVNYESFGVSYTGASTIHQASETLNITYPNLY